MNYLRTISIQLPLDHDFTNDFLELLTPLGNKVADQIVVDSTNPEYIPQLSVGFVDLSIPRVIFKGEEVSLSEAIVNQTEQQRESPHVYMPLSIVEVKNRIEAGGNIKVIDHLGVNFPWFDGLSPNIARLRQKLPRYCAYYRFPTGEEWDFIIPATELKITQGNMT